MKSYYIILTFGWLAILTCARVSNSSLPNRSPSPDGSWPRKASRNKSLSAFGAKVDNPNVVHVASSWDPNDVADDDLWQKSQAKGSWRYCLMDNTDEMAGQMEDPYGRTPKSARSPWRGTLGKLLG
jgi:hypothetical protein